MAPRGAQEQVHIRIAEADLARIDHAAGLARSTRSAFMLAAALAKAEEVLLDRQHYQWPDAAVQAFQAALAEPPAPAPRAAEAIGRLPWRAG